MGSGVGWARGRVAEVVEDGEMVAVLGVGADALRPFLATYRAALRCV